MWLLWKCACCSPPNGDKNTLLFLHCFSWQWLLLLLTGIVYYTNGFSERFIREFAAATALCQFPILGSSLALLTTTTTDCLAIKPAAQALLVGVVGFYCLICDPSASNPWILYFPFSLPAFIFTESFLSRTIVVLLPRLWLIVENTFRYISVHWIQSC